MADLLLLIGLVLVFWSFSQNRKRIEKETNQLNRLYKELDTAKGEVGRLMRELTEVSEQVVNNVSQQIDRAQQLMNEHNQFKGDTNEGASEELPVSVDPKGATEQHKLERMNKVVSLLDNRLKEKEVKARSSSQVNLHAEVLQEEMEVSAKHKAVYALAVMGYSVEQIARQMNIGKGEVSLILQLRKKGEEVNGLK